MRVNIVYQKYFGLINWYNIIQLGRVAEPADLPDDARVVKLAYTQGLGPCAPIRRGSSSLPSGTPKRFA